MTDRPYGDDADDDVFTGDYLDALFEVETSGEALPLEIGGDDPEPVVVDDAEFSLGPQLGEDLPPELHDDVAGSLELDPTDPGFTTADLEDLGPDEFDGTGEYEEEPVAEVPEEPPATEMQGDSVPTSDWLLGLGDPQPAGDDAGGEGGIPAGYEYLFRDGAEDDAGDEAPAGAAPGTGSGPADDVSIALPPEGGADSSPPADFELPDWAALSDDTVTSTTEYADLAAEVALSAGMVAEPSAISANMPGIDTGLVGMEDVVGETAPAPTTASATQPDLAMRVLTGLGLIALFALSLLWPMVLGALATIVFVAAAGELYAVLRANGLRPIPFVGLAGVLGALVGTWMWGLGAVPVALLLTLVVLALQMAMTGQRQEPLQDASLTMLGAVWIGGLGAFAFPLITAGDYRWLIVAVVTVVAGLDIGQFFIGRRMGKRPLAPVVSPKKTVEGLLGGAAVAVVVAVLLWVVSPLPLIPLVVLALVAVVLGPLGDLAVSVVKRILAVKDMGTILPGHGGILDRIDGLLFVVPAAWLVFEVAGLIT